MALNANVANAKDMLIDGVPLPEALNMASLYPAESIGVDDRYGKIEKGYKANLVFLDEELKVDRTIQMGEVVYQRVN